MAGEKISIKTKKGKYSLSTLPSEDFPIFSAEDENTFLSIPSQDLRDLIVSTSFAIDVSGWKDWLMGLFISANDGELVAVASDAIRLATAKKTIEANHSFSGVVPRKSINEISRFLSDHSGNVDFAINHSTVLLSTENLVFKSKLISGGHNLDYFQRVIPSGDSSVLECNTKELLEALNRISVLANDNLYNEVHLHASTEGLRLNANTKLSEVAEESAKSNLSGDEFKTVVNGSVLKEAITHIKTDNCHINFFGPDKVILVSPPNTNEQQYVVQPVKPVTLGSETIPAEATTSNVD
jgi:DNA polymerase-3 subunit beta